MNLVSSFRSRLPMRASFVLCAAVLALAGCNEKNKEVGATQVAAKVNKGEITVHQVNFAVQRANAGSPEQANKMAGPLLDKLVDQELLVQQALDKKLDRDPRVVQAMETARRDVLARAYAEQIATATPKPTEQEVKQYYAAHPALFSERRVYSLREVVIQNGPSVADQVKAQLEKSKNLEELVAWLKAQNLRFSANAVVKAAEQLPLDSLPRFHAMKDGDIKLVGTPQAIVVLQLVTSRSEPIDEEKARPNIEQYLSSQRRSDAVTAEVKRLKAAAKIEYLGEFAKMASASAPAANVAAAEPAPAQSAPAADALEQGIKSLK